MLKTQYFYANLHTNLRLIFYPNIGGSRKAVLQYVCVAINSSVTVYNFLKSGEMALWTSTVNDGLQLPKDFLTELNHDYKTLGSFDLDYAQFCKKYSIVPCPYFTSGFITPLRGICRLSNVEIDIWSWRAMLLSIAAIGYNIAELSFHNLTLTPQHIIELSQALDKIGKIEVLKLNYIRLISEDGAASAFKPIFSSTCGFDYLSLCGNKITDNFVVENSALILHNVAIHALNLNENLLSDVGASELLRTLRHNISLRYLSLKRNHCSGSCLEILPSIICGSQATAEDESLSKLLVKATADYSKKIKEINKKKKKLNLPEIDESGFSHHEKRIHKGEKGSPGYVVNLSLSYLDFSGNPIRDIYVAQAISTIHAKIHQISSATERSNLKLKLLGVGDEETQIRLRELILPDGIAIEA